METNITTLKVERENLLIDLEKKNGANMSGMSG